MTLSELISRFDRPVKSGAGYLVRCPAHEDHDPSLSISESDGTILLHCHAGCDPEAVISALGLEARDLFPQTNQSRKTGKAPRDKNRKIVAEYIYRNESGKEVAKKTRYEPKSFAWFRADWETAEIGTKLTWKPGLGQVKTPLYRWNEVKDSEWILLTEGEKDCDAGIALGLPCSTSGGVNSFREDHAETLRGKKIVICSDADDAGRVHALQVASLLWNIYPAGERAEIKIVEIPGSKDLAEATEKGTPKEVLVVLFREAPAWSPQPSVELLDEIYEFIRRYVSTGESEARAITLFVAHTHAFDAAEYTPYLAIISPEKQSGKTRLLDVLNMLCARPWMTGHSSAAALYRKVAAERPTLLLDELDTVFNSDGSEYSETLRGVLNNGFHLGGNYSVCTGQGANIKQEDFPTFCPKALAAIGKLPDTIRDRSIIIEMERAKRGTVKRMRISRIRPKGLKLAAKVSAWASGIVKQIGDSDPEMPSLLSDRQMDFCEPLLAIADEAGGKWPDLARAALVELGLRAQREDDSLGVELLKDCKRYFYPREEDERRESDRASSASLALWLGEMEERPWAQMRGGAPITPAQLASKLRRYKISPVTIRFDDGKRLKGYLRESFQVAWERYVNPAEQPTGEVCEGETRTETQKSRDKTD